MGGRSQTSVGDGADWYRLPVWYDVLHWAGTSHEVDGLERVALEYAGTRGVMRWFEPACGTGRYLREAASRGIEVAGVDREAAMIEYARRAMARRGLRATLAVGDMTAWRPPKPCDLAFCLVNSIRHLTSDRAMLEHFDCVARALKRGGVYVVGMNTTVYGGEMPSEDVWSGTRGRCEVRQIANYLPAEGPTERQRYETVVNHLARRTPKGTDHVDHTYRLRCYSMGQWRSLLERSALGAIAATDDTGEVLARDEDVFEHVWGYAWWVLAARQAQPARR